MRLLQNRMGTNGSGILFVLGMALLVLSSSLLAAGQEKATPQEIVEKVQAAAAALAQSSEAKPGGANLAQFNQKQSPWVWKDTYIFVVDCGQAIIAAHPISPELIGKEALSLLDTKGNPFFWQVCDALKKPDGLWLQYWWPKPGQKEGSRKISYALRAGKTPYVVGAGIYDDKATIADLEKLTRQTK